MTTAHRPTWNAAVASGTNPSGNKIMAQTTKVANRDAAITRKLKMRQIGQGTAEERGSRKELQQALERREKKAKEEAEGKKPKAIEENNPFPEDADDDGPPSPSEKSDAEVEDEDDDDDEEELMRELAKIKKEREAEEAKAKAEKEKQDNRAKREDIMKGNPLLQNADLSLKRKWDDDTAFKNQSRTVPKTKQRFINDMVRSDFHRKFLNKYVQLDTVYH
mmetsp:Transcript_104013/g.271589  ORF Transcript_104013/g.271589 Transcript_104013/m.271589 type:complete len:220 (-) Transcript_104013:63-722(-)